jgi:cytochrome c oxidase subunit 1
MFIMGWQGMPRRYYDYLPQFTFLHELATAGSFIMVVGIFAVMANLVLSVFRGKKAPSNPWGGATLEWTLPSPPPAEDFESPPVITKGPYEFEKGGRAA